MLHKVCGKLNLWYLETPKCTFALFTVMRILYFEDWKAAAAKPYSEIFSMCVQLLILAIKSFSLNAIKNLVLKIWSIFGSKALSLRQIKSCVHPSFHSHFYTSSSPVLSYTCFLGNFFVLISLYIAHISPFQDPVLFSLLWRFFLNL